MSRQLEEAQEEQGVLQEEVQKVRMRSAELERQAAAHASELERARGAEEELAACKARLRSCEETIAELQRGAAAPAPAKQRDMAL